MAGGKKKAATHKSRGKYSKYTAREKNKAARIYKNIMVSAKPGETAGKVIAKYEEVCKHEKAHSVVLNLKKSLNKRGIEVVAPEKKDG